MPSLLAVLAGAAIGAVFYGGLWWTVRRAAKFRRPGLAVLSVVLQPPRTEERLRKNPLGIYINGLSWSRELDATEGVKKP
ncbi:VirB8/TrbF family protein [Polaromonas sp.]|uniref:VirB8/TrbF family protein n=1 Tax=Polaromonas sp. TaxID=1869339 RepID=UPI0025E42A68|nr:VirB8/TrbF family protein [Polaromonas sp.]